MYSAHEHLAPVPDEQKSISIASYNVHQWIGCDKRYDPDRSIKVIQELNADIVGLQEVNFPADSNDEFSVRYLSIVLGMQALTLPTLNRRNGHFGNLLLTNKTILDVRRINLSVHSREPRGAIDADIQIDNKIMRVVVTHLGLGPLERRYQVSRLLDHLTLRYSDLTVILGDFNLWTPVGRALRRFNIRFGHAPSPRTFPAIFPILPLDRIWVSPIEHLGKIEAHSSDYAKKASDHLPVKAKIMLS